MRRQKSKQKSQVQKEYQILKSIHDQIQQQLYCLKKQQDILIKLIQRQQKKLKSQNKLLTGQQSYKRNLFKQTQQDRNHTNNNRQYVNNSRQYGNNQKESNTKKQARKQYELRSKSNDKQKNNYNITQNLNQPLDFNNYFYTSNQIQSIQRFNQPIQIRKSKKQDIFKMDQQLYQSDSSNNFQYNS